MRRREQGEPGLFPQSGTKSEWNSTMRWLQPLLPGIALLLVACGGGGSDSPPAAGTGAAPVPEAAAPAPAPADGTAPQSPPSDGAATDVVVVQTLACRGTPPGPDDSSAFQVTVEINYATRPWKWLRLVSPDSIPFATDPEGKTVEFDASANTAYVPGPDAEYIPGSNQIKGAYYLFDEAGLRLVRTRQYWSGDFPIVCERT